MLINLSTFKMEKTNNNLPYQEIEPWISLLTDPLAVTIKEVTSKITKNIDDIPN